MEAVMKYYISYFFLAILSVCLNAQAISFPDQWYFKAEDNPAFAEAAFNG